jgi:hypothetical protein
MATPFFCDRCGKAFAIRTEGYINAPPTVRLNMPHNPTNEMSEALEFGLCGGCYGQVRDFLGASPSPIVNDWQSQREVTSPRRELLPRLVYPKEIQGEDTDS